MPDTLPIGLSEKLQRLAEMKATYAALTSAKKDTEKEYRDFEASVVADMTEASMRSCVLDGLGSFALTTSIYSSVKNLTDMIHWAVENDLLPREDVDFLPNGRIRITFDVAMVEDDGDTKPSLVSGIVRADAYKAPLNEHVKLAIQEGSPEPPGVKANIRTGIRYTPRKGSTNTAATARTIF